LPLVPGASPHNALRAASTASPTSRLDFGASTQDSFSLRVRGGLRMRGFSQTPSTSCRTVVPSVSHSMSNVAARATTAACIMRRASSNPERAAARFSRA
jgi:hypothetical protein